MCFIKRKHVGSQGHCCLFSIEVRQDENGFEYFAYFIRRRPRLQKHLMILERFDA